MDFSANTNDEYVKYFNDEGLSNECPPHDRNGNEFRAISTAIPELVYSHLEV